MRMRTHLTIFDIDTKDMCIPSPEKEHSQAWCSIDNSAQEQKLTLAWESPMACCAGIFEKTKIKYGIS